MFDLDRYVDLDVGAYGDDNTDRPKLVAIAHQRATAKHGMIFDRDNTVVIGDSSHDIRTGLHGGAHAIGVASGSESAEQLRATGAIAAWNDLTDTAAITALLTHVT